MINTSRHKRGKYSITEILFRYFDILCCYQMLYWELCKMAWSVIIHCSDTSIPKESKKYMRQYRLVSLVCCIS